MPNRTNASRAYQHLRNKLIAGDFEPGSRLLYGPIGKEIGVSATPVREAAGQLAKEGLVELVPNMGAIVRKLDRDDLIEIYEVREIIEVATAALAAQRASSDSIKRIKSELSEMQSLAIEQSNAKQPFAGKRIRKRFDRADFQFHLLIIESTQNTALVHTASQSHVLTRVFGIPRHAYDAEGMQRTYSEHKAIIDAIVNGDAQAASIATETHIRNGLAQSLAALDSNEQ